MHSAYRRKVRDTLRLLLAGVESSDQELSSITGLPASKVKVVRLVVEELRLPPPGQELASPSQVLGMIRPELQLLPHEEVHFIFTDSGCRFLGKKRFVGKQNDCPVDITQVARMLNACDGRVHSVVVCHNHPNGDPLPSDEDNQLTLDVAQMLSTLGINFDDHIIVSGNKHFSFAENNPEMLD